jgi:hypothetical protein
MNGPGCMSRTVETAGDEDTGLEETLQARNL